MSTATETAQPIARPQTGKQAFRKSTVGRMLFRSPFYFLVIVIFVYALFPFFWAIRSSFTPEGDLKTMNFGGGEGSKNLVPITGGGSAWAVLGLVRSGP